MEELFEFIEELEWNEYKSINPQELNYHEICRRLLYLALIAKQEWEEAND